MDWVHGSRGPSGDLKFLIAPPGRPDGVQGGVNRASRTTKRASIQVKVFENKKTLPVRATDTFFQELHYFALRVTKVEGLPETPPGEDPFLDPPQGPQGPPSTHLLDPPGISRGCSYSLRGTTHAGTVEEITMEPAVSSLQPPAGSPQTGPAECAERLNPPPPVFSREQGVLDLFY